MLQGEEKELNFIKNNPFSTLISSKDSEVVHISKAPLLLKESSDSIILEGHLAKINPHINFLKEVPLVTLVFDGAHGYISPTWYKDLKRNVPTWNYTTVSVTGKVEIISSNEWLLNSVMELTDTFEQNDSWKKNVDPEYVKNLSHGIIGIKITAESIKSRFKLSQNRDSEDKQRMIDNLSEHNPNLAEEMKNS